MLKNARKVINTKIFKANTGEYLGRLWDISFSPEGEIRGYCMKTDSIVPLDVWICPGMVRETGKGKMYVNEISEEKESHPITFKKDIKKKDIYENGVKAGIGRDMIFDIETGEIKGFLYAENIFSKPRLTETNKIELLGKNKGVKFERSGKI